MKAAVISDLHFVSDPHFAQEGRSLCEGRLGGIADRLLVRAVEKLKDASPDLLILCGDLVNDPADLGSLRKLRTVLDGIDMPMIVIPGNHDPLPETFYTVMPRPPEYLDAGNVRFVPFCDRETPGWNAVRSQDDIARMKRCRDGFGGRIVSVQHTPLFEAGSSDCCYAVENAAEVIDGSFEYAISGHYHPGMPPARGKRLLSWIVPALCEKPFGFAVIDFGDGTGTPDCRFPALEPQTAD